MPSKIDDYECSRTLGKGHYSIVKLAKDQSGKLWAIKVFRKNDPKFKGKMESLVKSLRTEVEALKNLSHPNMVNMKDHKEDALWVQKNKTEPIMYIVLEYI